MLICQPCNLCFLKASKHKQIIRESELKLKLHFSNEWMFGRKNNDRIFKKVREERESFKHEK